MLINTTFSYGITLNVDDNVFFSVLSLAIFVIRFVTGLL